MLPNYLADQLNAAVAAFQETMRGLRAERGRIKDKPLAALYDARIAAGVKIETALALAMRKTQLGIIWIPWAIAAGAATALIASINAWLTGAREDRARFRIYEDSLKAGATPAAAADAAGLAEPDGIAGALKNAGALVKWAALGLGAWAALHALKG